MNNDSTNTTWVVPVPPESHRDNFEDNIESDESSDPPGEEDTISTHRRNGTVVITNTENLPWKWVLERATHISAALIIAGAAWYSYLVLALICVVSIIALWLR